jgi:hypothetical protein
MHNKRIGRDDILKIEVSHPCPPSQSISNANPLSSGLELPRPPLGGLIALIVTAVIVVVIVAVIEVVIATAAATATARLAGLPAAGRLVLDGARETTPQGRMTVGTAIMTVIAATLVTALAAQIGRPFVLLFHAQERVC